VSYAVRFVPFVQVLTTGDERVNLPLNLARLIWNAQTKFGCKPHRCEAFPV
jgi:hypothetical protein